MNQSLQDHCDRLAKTNAEQYAELREARDALAAKDAEIERLQRDLGLAAQHAAASDAECERRIAAHQAAEAEIARLKKEHKALRVDRKVVLKRAEAAEAEAKREKIAHDHTSREMLRVRQGYAEAIATERERCARVAESFAPWEPDEAFMRKRPEEGEVIQANYDRTQAIAAAIRAG